MKEYDPWMYTHREGGEEVGGGGSATRAPGPRSERAVQIHQTAKTKYAKTTNVSNE